MCKDLIIDVDGAPIDSRAAILNALPARSAYLTP